MKKTLEESRQTINELDKQLMALFEQRMAHVKDVVDYKVQHHLPIFHPQREQEVIQKNISSLKDENLRPYAQQFIQALMTISKAYQYEHIGLREMPLSKKEKVTIGFQGVPGSFSEEALVHYFGEAYKTVAYQRFEDVFEALKYKEITYGILPIENSSTGSITQIYDLLKHYGYAIVGETTIKIQQHLLGHKGTKLEEIETIYSHEQGFSQSSDFLKTLPTCQHIPYYNTAISAKYVSESKDTKKAAIGSRRAAALYDLAILKENINNAKVNCTRFIIIGTQLEHNELCNKITLLFTLPNEAGTLYEQLSLFKEAGINMIKIESRPVGDGSFSYFFYVDIDGHIEDEVVKETLNKIAKATQNFSVLGCYKKNS